MTANVVDRSLQMTLSTLTLSLTDPARRNWQNTAPRPMVTDLWYPAAEDVTETPIQVGAPGKSVFDIGSAAQNAPLAATPEQFPLIMLSHGTGGTATGLGWLAGPLARQGYIVAGVNHHGNTGIEPYVVQGFTHVWERARDISEVLTQLLEHPTFGPRIRRDQIGAAGFSLGGYTVMALAGGIFDLQAFHNAYKKAGRKFIEDVPPEFPDPVALADYFEKLADTTTEYKQSFRDERIRAVFAIAPVLGQGFSPEGLAPIQIPVEMVVGASDTQAVPAINAEFFAAHIANATLTVLPAPIAHYTFLPVCTEFGKQVIPDLCLDEPGVDRAAVHAQVSSMAQVFFDTQLC